MNHNHSFKAVVANHQLDEILVTSNHQSPHRSSSINRRRLPIMIITINTSAEK
jgi:hypothetical protein